MMPKTPDRFCVDTQDRALYEQLVNEGLFKGKNRRDQFLFAMAFGFKNKVSLKLETKETGGFFVVEDLRPEDSALIYSVAISEKKSPEVLSNWKEVVEIAEKYAHGGIKLLADKLSSTQFGTFQKQFEKEIYEMYRQVIPSQQEPSR